MWPAPATPAPASAPTRQRLTAPPAPTATPVPRRIPPRYRGGLTVPSATILDIPQSEQDWMRAELRRARHGYVLALHVLLLCAAGRTPTEIATVLFCSRSSVYRIVTAYCAQRLAALRAEPTAKAAWLTPSLRRSLLAVLTKVPAAYGW